MILSDGDFANMLIKNAFHYLDKRYWKSNHSYNINVNYFVIVSILILSVLSVSCDSGELAYQKSRFEVAFEDSIKILLENNDDINRKNDEGFTPLYVATVQLYVDAVKILLENGADPNISIDLRGFTPLHGVMQHRMSTSTQCKREEEIIRLLIQHGAQIDALDKNSDPPLNIAVRGGREDFCRLLIENGVDVNTVNRGYAPLHWAARFGYWQAAKALILGGANINVKTLKGETPLSLAKERKFETYNEEKRKGDKDFAKGADYNKTIQVLKEHGAR